MVRAWRNRDRDRRGDQRQSGRSRSPRDRGDGADRREHRGDDKRVSFAKGPETGREQPRQQGLAERARAGKSPRPPRRH